MVQIIHDFLKLYITEDGIPLKQVLNANDMHQISVTLAHMTTAKSKLDFQDISDNIFKALGTKGEKALEYPIQSIPFEQVSTEEERIANIALLGYYCFIYFDAMYELPIEKILVVVNTYMKQHIVSQDITHTLTDLHNPISNLIAVSETEYVRYNGKQVLPPFNNMKDNFIKQINELLIK